MGAAHFTLRCGRQLGDGSTGAPAYQLPLVALVCNFGSAALVSDLIHSLDCIVGACSSRALSCTATGAFQTAFLVELTACCVACNRACRSWRRCIMSSATRLTPSCRALSTNMLLVSGNILLELMDSILTIFLFKNPPW